MVLKEKLFPLFRLCLCVKIFISLKKASRGAVKFVVVREKNDKKLLLPAFVFSCAIKKKKNIFNAFFREIFEGGKIFVL
jgi:hypothetical protein